MSAVLDVLPLAYTGIHQRAQDWVIIVAWVALAIGFLCTFIVLYDIYGRGYRQKMGIMEAVWPITGLYWGPVMLWFYFRRGRKKSPKWMDEHPDDQEDLGGEVMGAPWFAVSKGDSHCGAGCTLGDVTGEWLIWLIGFSIPVTGYFVANEYFTMILADFVLAWTLGIVFQYFTIAPMRGLGLFQGIIQAIKADTASIVAFQVGLFGYMALYHFVLWEPPLSVDSPEYWFMMQIGMIVGFFTAWPVNAWLIKSGIKEKM